MYDEQKGQGTSSSPIVLVDSGWEADTDMAEPLVQVSGSPLKVVCSKRYR